MSSSGDAEAEAEAEYFSKDFEWEEVRADVESNPSFRYHLLPFQPSKSQAESDVRAWKRFHVRHSSGKFFKVPLSFFLNFFLVTFRELNSQLHSQERRYLLKEFPELVSSAPHTKLLEVGCGNGSTALPILRANKDVIVYACDCSDETLEKAKEILGAATIVAFSHRFHTFYCDVSTDGFPNWLVCNPCRDRVLQKPSMCLSGLYDMTMLRFEEDKRVGFREYMRLDGTRAYFFCLDTVRDLFVGSGFTELELDYCCVKSVNRQKGKCMRRIWVHGKFQKPVLN
ncbi:O-methyltransferase [Arachis hypogaea]|nr:O-methyltransferase [Arachis hypogaea]